MVGIVVVVTLNNITRATIFIIIFTSSRLLNAAWGRQ